MTDYEKVIALFTELGIGFELELFPIEDFPESTIYHRVMLDEGKPKIVGYCGFSTIFNFDKNGKFIEVGAYE